MGGYQRRVMGVATSFQENHDDQGDAFVKRLTAVSRAVPMVLPEANRCTVPDSHGLAQDDMYSSAPAVLSPPLPPNVMYGSCMVIVCLKCIRCRDPGDARITRRDNSAHHE